MAGIGFGPFLEAIGAGLGQGVDQIAKQRQQQQQLELQKFAMMRDNLMLQDYLRKQGQGQMIPGVVSDLSSSFFGGGTPAAGNRMTPIGGQAAGGPGSDLPGGPYVASGPTPGASGPQSAMGPYGGMSLPAGPQASSFTGGSGDPRGVGPLIQAASAKYGVDPAIAMRVAQSEGLGNYTGDGGTSFGAFQLHTGGGLGDEFKQQTGLDPSNPKNEPAEIDWALKNAARTGWSPYHGAARMGIGPREGIGGTSQGGSPPQGGPQMPGLPGAPNQLAQASPGQTGDPANDAGPPAIMPPPRMPNDAEILRAMQVKGVDPSNFKTVKEQLYQTFREKHQEWMDQYTVKRDTRSDAAAQRSEATSERAANTAARQAEQAGVSEPFNAQITADGKTTTGMVYTVKGKPGFWDADTGERIKGKVTKTTGSMNAPIDDETANMLAEARLKGDQSVMQGLGYGNQGAANREKVYAAMRAQGATGSQIAAARAEYSAAIAGAQTAGRRGAQIGMAINELQGFIPEAKRISSQLDRTQFPTLNSVLLSAQAGTGNEDVKRLALVTNEVINAYASVAVRTGQTTDAARAQGAAILDKAFTQGQYAAVLDEMMNLAQTAKGATSATVKDIVDRLAGNSAAPQQGAPQGAPAPAGGGELRYDAQGNRIQ